MNRVIILVRNSNRFIISPCTLIFSYFCILSFASLSLCSYKTDSQNLFDDPLYLFPTILCRFQFFFDDCFAQCFFFPLPNCSSRPLSKRWVKLCLLLPICFSFAFLGDIIAPQTIHTHTPTFKHTLDAHPKHYHIEQHRVLQIIFCAKHSHKKKFQKHTSIPNNGITILERKQK